jgi:predicted Zn-dependent protease
VNESSGSKPDLASVLHEAHALVERRRYAQARSVVARGLSHFPDDSELQYLGAFVDYAEDRHAEAMQSIRRVLAQNPQHYGARMLCAHLHDEAQEFPQAEQLWIELLREYPEDPDCYAAYAELMLKTLNLDKAERLAREGLRHAPEHHRCLFVATMIDLIRSGGSRQRRSENLERLLREHPEHVRSSIALAVALNERGEPGNALRVAQELVRNQPDSEHLVTFARELKLRNHWSMLPLYPMLRWGWGGAAFVTLGGIFALRAARGVLPESVVVTLGFVWLGYVIYSWTWPAILRKLL